MSKEELVEMEGVVVECCPGTTFKVKINETHEITATLSGKMRKFNIRVLLGDRVAVEMTPYDLTRGRIIYRFK